MSAKHNLLAICGSTRKASTNHRLLQAISGLTIDFFQIELYNRLSDLPPFNPDLSDDPNLQEVNEFRDLVRKSAAVIICTPEYAHGVPGSLKNAIDWTVS